MTPLPWVRRIFWHRFVRPDLQNLHSPHSGVYSGITWSPGLTEVTPGPTSSTTPPPSWPRMTGNMPSGSAPDSVNASVWQTPVATIRTSTSPAFGPSRSTCSMLSGLPASHATAARVFIALELPLAVGCLSRARCALLLCAQRRRVMAQVILDERADEIVAVIVAGLQPQL